MTDKKNREVLEIQRNDFTPREVLSVVSSFWKSVANIFYWMRNVVLTTFIKHKRILYVYMDCDQCFGVDVTMETPSLHQPAATCFKTSTTGKCSLEHVRKRTTQGKNDINALNKIYEELQNFQVFDTGESTNAGKNSVVSKAKFGGITENSKLTEKSYFETSNFEECISRICRISLSDFTATFNKFVRQNGLDFSKSDLSWWFDKFTKYIYLKEVLNGEPTQLREQLIFRSIQSKRDSIMQRLYTLRDKHELHLSVEEFFDRLKAQSLDPIRKLVQNRKGSGDGHEVRDVIIANESNPSKNGSQKEPGDVTVHENTTANGSAKPGESTHHASSEVKPENFDLQNEILPVENKTKDNKQKKMSASLTKQKKETPKTQEKEKVLEPNVKELVNTLYPGCKIIPLGPQNMTPSRDESKLLNAKIYITRDGLVKVSKYLDSNSDFKRVSNTGYEQARIINFFVDPLDEKNPLPPNVEVKPMPSGGIEEALLDMQKSTKEEIDEISSEATEMLRFRENCEKLNKLDASAHVQNSANVSQNAKFDDKSVNLWSLPPQYLLQSQLNFGQILKEGIEYQLGKPLKSLERLGQHDVESKIKQVPKSLPTRRSNLNDGLGKQDGTLRTGTKQESQNKEQGLKKQKPVLEKRKSKKKLEDQPGQHQSQERSDSLSKEATPHAPCIEVLDKQDKHQFDQLPPLNFIDTDNENEASCAIKEPVYYETNATVDYSRHAVEPSHGDRPNKKQLQAIMKEKIKTKGEANKHLKARQENTPYLYEEINADDFVNDTVFEEEESELDLSTAEQAEEVSAETLIVCATDQPQVQDNREFMMVPEEIKRLEDPRLKEIEDKYSLACNTAKKDKKKRKDKKVKVKRNIPLVLVTDY